MTKRIVVGNSRLIIYHHRSSTGRYVDSNGNFTSREYEADASGGKICGNPLSPQVPWKRLIIMQRTL